jgi:hypothetical protein
MHPNMSYVNVVVASCVAPTNAQILYLVDKAPFLHVKCFMSSVGAPWVSEVNAVLANQQDAVAKVNIRKTWWEERGFLSKA